MAFRKIYKEDLKLSIDGSTLKLSNHILTDGSKRTTLTADVSAAGTTLTVANFNGMADDDYLLIGEWGEPTAEIVQVGAEVTTASITVGALGFDHYTDAPVTVIPCESVYFARATTLVDPNDAGTVTQLGSDIPVMAYRTDTIYEDATNTSGYGYARFKKTQTTATYSEYSVGVAYEGNAYNSVEEMCKEAVNMIGIEIGDEHAKESQLIRDINEAQNVIVKKNDWVFELIKNETSIATTENEYKYALSGLTYSLKYPDSKQGILNVHFGDIILNYLDNNAFDELMEGIVHTELAADSAIAATTVTLDDSYEFAEEGTVYIGSNAIVYTTNTETTGVLSGIATSGDDSIEVAVSENDTVWQGVKPGEPEHYTIFNGNIYVDVPVETDSVGKKLKFKYLKQLSRFTDFSDTTTIPFYEALEKYVAYKIEIRRGNIELAGAYRNEFEGIVKINEDAYKIPLMDQLEYYNFGFDGTISSNKVI